MTTNGGLPDFIIIGAMKSGTTTLFRHLEAQPEIHGARLKEPNFFGDDAQWQRGIDWYRSLFEGAVAGQLLGEATPMYATPARSTVAATRIRSVCPDVRLIYLVREPLSRMWSDFQHHVQRGRERRSYAEALADPESGYVRRSCYYSSVRPFLQGFPADQLSIRRFEDLVRPGGGAWDAIIAFLGLPPRPQPTSVHNASDGKRRYRPVMRWLYDANLVKTGVPGPLKPLARRVMTSARPTPATQTSAATDVPVAVLERIATDNQRLEEHVGIRW